MADRTNDLYARSHSPSKRSRFRGVMDDAMDPAFSAMAPPPMAEQVRMAAPSPVNLKPTGRRSPQTAQAPTSSPRYFRSTDVPSMLPQTPSPPKPYTGPPSSDSPSSSVYSEEPKQGMVAPDVSPLRIQKSPEIGPLGDGERRPSLLQDYTDWATTKAPGEGGRYSRGTSRGLGEAEGPTRDIYSPLHRLSQGTDQTPVRRGRKVMVGYNGWLEKTGKSRESRASTPKKIGGILDTLKKLAKDVVSRGQAAA